MDKKIMTPRETVEYLGNIVSLKSLARWRSDYNQTGRNYGPRFVRLGGKIGYRVVDVDKWCVTNEVDSTGRAA